MPVPDSTESALQPQPDLLATTDLVIEGQMPWSSNATFLCQLWPAGTRPDAGLNATGDQLSKEVPESAAGLEPLGRAIYKPHQGERPLWDFPDGLYLREAAAFQLSEVIGWDLIPPTIVRTGPLGIGSLQWFIDADFEQHHFNIVEDESSHEQLRRMAAFDIVANSTDRKAGHVLIDPDDHIWGIDNGLCLHAEFKLRTVIWDFSGEPISESIAADLDRFLTKPLPDVLADVLDPFERDALTTRTRALLAEGHLPFDPTGRRVPWPLV